MRLRTCAALDVALGIVPALLLAAVIYIGVVAPKAAVVISPDWMVHDVGHSFSFTVPKLARWPYVTPAPPAYTVLGPDMVLLEAGRRLGPETYWERVQNEGLGRYRPRDGRVWFSSSDNSDPRANGKTYLLIVQTRINAKLEWFGLAVFLIGTVIRVRRLGLRPDRAAAMAFFVPVAAVLIGLCASTLIHPMPPLFTSDSFEYVNPGLKLAAGAPVIHDSSRGIGYPALIAGLLKFATLHAVPVLQLFLLVAAVLALSVLLFLFLRTSTRSLARSQGRTAAIIRLAIITLLGFTYATLVVTHDQTTLNLYMLMAETPHLAFSALGLLFLVLSWIVRGGATRIPLALAAVVALYFSTLIKPLTLLPLGVAALSLLGILWLERRNFWGAANLIALAGAVTIVAAAYSANEWIASPAARFFGPQTLFCNHIRIVLPIVGAATPERADLSRLLRGVLALGPRGWSTLGQDGDQCMYKDTVNAAIGRVVESEHTERASWLTEAFLSGVIADPTAYLRIVDRQLARYFHHPFADKWQAEGTIDEGDWDRIARFAPLLGMTRADFTAGTVSWVSHDFQPFSWAVSHIRDVLSPDFAPVIIMATVVAVVSLLRRRSPDFIEPELIVLCVGAFTLSYALVIALSHSFDHGRYTAGMQPFTILWYVISASYVIYRMGDLVRLVTCSRASSAPVWPPNPPNKAAGCRPTKSP
jgi:hypothetical protein